MTETEKAPLAAAADWPEILVGLMEHRDMDAPTARWAMDEIMSGRVSEAIIAAFLVAHHGKGETVDEVEGLVTGMLDHAVSVFGLEDSVDIVGTGGDRAKTVNISSTSAFVISAAGSRVVKHGNRASSSASGSADVLESLGVKLNLDPQQVSTLARETGLAFLFANEYHPAMRHVAPVRRTLGVPTAFNVLGPLTNPARVRSSAIGVADVRMAPLITGVLARRDARALVFRSQDGLDEFSTTAVNDVWEVRDGSVTHAEIDAQDLGLERASKGDLRGGTPEFNADAIRSVLQGERGPVRDIVLLNSAAALTAADAESDTPLEDRLKAKLTAAQEAVDSGAALSKMRQMIEVSHRV